MWTPPQRIRHQAPPGGWPTADQAERSLWFSPLRVGCLTLEQRTWVPAMVPWRATDEGFVTRQVLDWYARFAQGRPGAIVVEATGIRDIPSGPLLRIGHDRFLPGLERLVKTVREASDGHTRLLIQLIDFLTVRRRPAPDKYFARYLTLTERHREAFPGLSDEAVRQALAEADEEKRRELLSEREREDLERGYRERVTDTHLHHIRELPRVLPGIFAEAAVRARKAGFDGVELHYAHAYTMASFLSALNSRDDGYGGSREGRVRLPLEVFERVRRTVGADYTVGCRFLTRDCLQGGSQVEDACYYACRFAEAGMDFLSLSRGGKFEDARQPGIGWAVYPYTGPSGYECMPTVISDERGPFGRNAEDATRVRQAVRSAGYTTPMVVVGGVTSFAQAEAMLASGCADVVGAARQTLADPDWFLKVRLGLGEQVRRCKYTNYCEGLDQKHKQVTCQLWDRPGIGEPGVALARDGRRRLVAPPWRPEPGKVYHGGVGRSTDMATIRAVSELDIGEITAIDEKIGGSYRPEVWERRVGYYIRRDPEASKVAEENGKVVGFMLGEVRGGEFGLDEPTGWIEVLGVDPEHRGHSIGRRLAEAMLTHFRACGATAVRTLVHQDMEEIYDFFCSLGFETAAIRSLEMSLVKGR